MMTSTHSWHHVASFLLFGLSFQPAAEVDIACLPVGSLKANCYILSDPPSRDALVIDPGAEGRRIIDYLLEKGLWLEGVVVTHAHPDHYGACADLQKSASVPIWIHAGDLVAAQNGCQKVRFESIEEDGLLRIGAFDLEIINTSGHTPGSICVKWKDNLFSGDTLFLQSVGRSSKPGVLTDSIREKLWRLADWIKVYPGHGPATSIGYEKRYNPFAYEEPASHAPSIEWIDDKEVALERAKQENRPVLLLLTVEEWPCARGYCDSLFQDCAVAELVRQMVNCRINLTAQPDLVEKYSITQNPSHLPAIILLDREGTVLDVLEKLPVEEVRDTVRSVLDGERPMERFKACQARSIKSGTDYVYMADYLARRDNLGKAISYLEKARIAAQGDDTLRRIAERQLLDAYTRSKAFDDALQLADLLLAHKCGLQPVDYPRILLKKCLLLHQKRDAVGCQKLVEEFIRKYGSEYDISGALLVKGLSQMSESKYEEALETLNEIGADAPANTRAHSLYLKGYCHLLQQKYDEARECFANLARDYPDSPYAEKASRYLLKIVNRQ